MVAPVQTGGRGDSSRLGSDEKNLAESKTVRPSERARASQRQGEVWAGSLTGTIPVLETRPNIVLPKTHTIDIEIHRFVSCPKIFKFPNKTAPFTPKFGFVSSFPAYTKKMCINR
jgi:hypothetical protein